jgi:hypothetical protein
MARNGSGTYSNPYPNFVSGTVISSTEVDANNSDSYSPHAVNCG